MNTGEKIVLYQIIIVISALIDMVWAIPIKWAWNIVMPFVFGLPRIAWIHAWCLLFILTHIWKIKIVSVKDGEW